MGLSRVEELEAKCTELEKLREEAGHARDEAIEERNRATVILAFQLDRETGELSRQIDELNEKNNIILDENEDLSIKLEFARKDWKNLQLESEKHITERDEEIEKVKELVNKNSELTEEVKELLEKLQNVPTASCSTNATTKNSETNNDKKNNDVKANSNNTNTNNSNTINSNRNNNSNNTCTTTTINDSSSNTKTTNNSNTTTTTNSNNNSKNNHINNNNTTTNNTTTNNNSSSSNNNNKSNSDDSLEEDTKQDTHQTAAGRRQFDDMDWNKEKTNIKQDDELEPRPPITLKNTPIEDDYDVHEELGKGKFGIVKRVTVKTSGEVHAAKYIKTSAVVSGSSRDEVLKEMRIMGKLHHKRLVGLLAAYETGKTIIMIMEFVSGGELFERVVDEDCLTEKEAAYYMHQLLQGLRHVHSKNIIHLDLKPENIVCVSKDSWDIKLIDFGLAHEIAPGTKIKAMKGTPEFMAPETVNYEAVSKPADMWGVGVIAYILLSGLSPFMGDDDNETLSNVTTADWDFEDEAFDVISHEARQFISELLVKNPGQRNTVEQCLNHDWMKKSASANAVKIDTKKLKQFLAKRRWQKSVNALVAVRRLSSMASLLGLNKSRPSIAPMLDDVPGCDEEENEEEDETIKNGNKNEMVEKIEKEKENEEIETKPKTVQVNGDKHTDKSGSGDKRMQKMPAFINELEDITVSEGESVNMEVTINGGPGCEVEWFFDGGDVGEREGLTILDYGDGTHAVVIDECDEDDTGEYSCVVESVTGRAVTKGYLTVEVESDEESGADIDPPIFHTELTDMTAREGETVTLAVEVAGEDYELEWFKNAVDVVEGGRFSFTTTGEGRHALVIAEVEDDDTGEYCCVAQNDGGRSTCAGYFTVEVEDEEGDEDESEEETDEEFYEENIQVRPENIEDFYAIEEEIGRGRFGIVRKCVHIKSGIHFIAKSIKTRPSQKEEYKREVDVMNVLRHPNLCRLREAFETAREIVIVMEYNRGGDLLQRINEMPMSEPESVAILQQLLDAVSYIHENSYMHLDIKPENVMFKRSRGTTIKLIDFSLARKYDPKVETKISQGTAEYVAPEVVNYDCVTPATDMWAIGITSYMMLSGISPFLGDSEADTFANITQCAWKFTDVFNDVSDEAKEFIRRLLVKGTAGRMTTVDCLAHPWITTVGLKGQKHRTTSTISHATSLSDISNSLLANGDLHESISSMESYLRLNSANDEVFDTEEDQKQSTETKELEATLQTFLLKLSEVESERADLEEKLDTQQATTVELEQNLAKNHRESTARISELEKQNENLSKQIKTKTDLLVKVGHLETQRKELEDELLGKTKQHKALEERYNNVRTKMDEYDSLEEKMYRCEREKKESILANKRLEEKLEDFRAVEKELRSKTMENEEKSKEVTALRKEKDELEEKYQELKQEKENLSGELKKKFSIMEQGKTQVLEEKEVVEKKVKKLENELKKRNQEFSEVNEMFEKTNKDVERFQKTRSERFEEDISTLNEEKIQLEQEVNKNKKQNEESRKTCEDLASKLSKSYGEIEKLKTQNSEKIDEFKRESEDLKRKCLHLNNDLESRDTRVSELQQELNSRDTNVSEHRKELKSRETRVSELQKELKLRDTNVTELQKELKIVKKENQKYVEVRENFMQRKLSETNCESLRTTVFDLESTILAHKSSIAVSKGEIELLQEKLAVEKEQKDLLKDQLLGKKREIDSLSSKLTRRKSTEKKLETKQREFRSEELEKLREQTNQLTKQNAELNLVVKDTLADKNARINELALLKQAKKQLEKTIEETLQPKDDIIISLLRKELEELQTSFKKISKHKEELTLGLVLRDKKIALFEKELEDLEGVSSLAGVAGRIQNGGSADEAHAHYVVVQLKNDVREAKYKAASSEAELEQLQQNYQTKLKIEQEGMENKWAKRLRKECSELQAELSEKYAQEKRAWLKKEAELQNMIRQMKLILDKRAKEAEQEKKRLERELAEARSCHGSTASLNSSSISDENVDGSSHPGHTEEATSNDCKRASSDGLNDRDLRRVAYKLTNDEWSQLGTFLGVSDPELQKVAGLKMGPQEKAFRIMSLWRTQSFLAKNQLVAQLAVALEEINRKDVAQFVVEQMMSGKPRKKFFGWRK